MGQKNPGKKTLGRYEVLKADPDKPRSIKNVATVNQDSKDKGKLGTRKPTGNKVANVVGRSAKTGQVRSRPTNLKKFPKPRPIIPTPVGVGAALAPIAYEQTSEQKKAGSDSMGKTMPTRRKDTVRDIKGTPAEIAADKERAKGAKEKNVPKPKRKPKVPTSTKKSSNPEVYVDSSVTYDMDNMPKKMSGGKVNYRKSGGKIGRGCGAALRGGGKVMK
jgi:hypothetical protein